MAFGVRAAVAAGLALGLLAGCGSGGGGTGTPAGDGATSPAGGGATGGGTRSSLVDAVTLITGDCTGIAFSPNSRQLVAACEQPGQSQVVITFWDPTTGQKTADYPLPGGNAESIFFTADGTQLVHVSVDELAYDVSLWDATTPTKLGPPDGVFGTVKSGSGVLLADDTFVSENAGRVVPGTGESKPTPLPYGLLTITADRTVVASSDAATPSVTVWNTVLNSTKTVTLASGGRAPVPVAISPDGQTLVAGDVTSNVVTRWDVASGGQVGSVAVAGAVAVLPLAYTPDGAGLLAELGVRGGDGSTSPSFVVLDPGTGSVVQTLTMTGDLGTVVVSPDGRFVATATDTGSSRGVLLWSLAA